MILIVLALYAPVAHAMTALAPFNPLSTCGKGKQSADLVGWGSLGLIKSSSRYDITYLQNSQRFS
ncbi:MAG: hypothetical protein RMY64_07420 [Nostoc sp. DedQUE08]|uniref:hypothetical protein n=1 Tax=Nostoc sp. DedQUE08 TaxID=3075393 RepID=UPI002AD542BD|nr:hypothetical protein [Nostoc sp. DedQUE08]MDZ8065457.1 hypothetical protein [Nostoc sp. DedQUE08]